MVGGKIYPQTGMDDSDRKNVEASQSKLYCRLRVYRSMESICFFPVASGKRGISWHLLALAINGVCIVLRTIPYRISFAARIRCMQ